MTNRNSLLGRSRPRGKLTREEIAALDEATVPPAPAAKSPGASRFLHSDVVGEKERKELHATPTYYASAASRVSPLGIR